MTKFERFFYAVGTLVGHVIKFLWSEVDDAALCPEPVDDPDTEAWFDQQGELCPWGERMSECTACGHTIHYPVRADGSLDSGLVVAAVLEHCLDDPDGHGLLLAGFETA